MTENKRKADRIHDEGTDTEHNRDEHNRSEQIIQEKTSKPITYHKINNENNGTQRDNIPYKNNDTQEQTRKEHGMDEGQEHTWNEQKGKGRSDMKRTYTNTERQDQTREDTNSIQRT